MTETDQLIELFAEAAKLTKAQIEIMKTIAQSFAMLNALEAEKKAG